MRLRVQFGTIDERECSWYRPVEDFPILIKFLGRNYEWFSYDKDLSGKADMILNYAELPTYDPNYDVFCTTWEELSGNSMSGCQCGAEHTSFKDAHMFFCPKWRRW